MKSIVERAREAYPINEYPITVGAMIRDAYIRGAKEQQAIDEVCNWLKTNIKWMSNQLMNILIYELRKAMEE